MGRILGLFLVSGALGLGYQVLWSKLVLLFVGVSSWSYAVVLAAFMCGLALGSRIFGRIVDRVRSPLKLFAFLELGVGLYAVAYMPLSDGAALLYARLVAFAPHESGGMHGLAAKALVAGLLLLPPTILMGGTYPALVRHASRSLELVGRRASQLYAVNAGGAVLGTLLMAFVLMPRLGISASLMLLAVGNGCVGLLALAFARGERVRDEAETMAAPVAGETGAPAPTGVDDGGESARSPVRLALGLVFVAGFVSFTLEVAWTRLFSMSMGSSTYSFAVILAAFITGISLGSAILSRIEARITRPLAFFGWTQLCAALLVLVPLPLSAIMPWAIGRLARDLPSTEAGYRLYELLKFSACLVVMLPPALFLGVSIPLMVKATSRSLAAVGRDTGSVYAWNTVGNVLGALVAGLVLLPLLGVQHLIQATCAAIAISGLAAIVLASGQDWRRSFIRASLPAGVALALALFLPAWDGGWFTLSPFRRHHSTDFQSARALVKSRKVVLDIDDPAASIIVQASRNEDDPTLVMLVNGKPDASNTGDAPTQLLLAHVPLLLHEDPRNVLVIGLASGLTCGAVLCHPVDRLDIVDIVQSMPRASALFDEWNGRPLEDQRTTFIADDARSFLSTTTADYDVVISVPSNPWTAGTGSLFSSEFFGRAASRMRPGGLYVQWLQGYEVGDPLLVAMIRSFRSAFPHVSLYDAAPGDMLLVGSREAVVPDVARMTERMLQPRIEAQLVRVKVHRVEDLLYLQHLSPVTIDWIASQSALENTDDNLLLEYGAPRDLFLRRRPQVLDALDERRVGAPSLPWTREVWRESAGAQAWDPGPLVAMLAARPLGDPRLLESLLAAMARTEGIPIADVVGRLGGRISDDARVPPTQAELLAALDGAVSRGDDEALADLLRAHDTAIVDAAIMTRAAADDWSRTIETLASGSAGRSATRLRLLHCDVLAASGQTTEALRVLAVAMSSDSPPSPEEALLRTCRIDGGDRCTALARTLHAATGDERLARFVDWRERVH